MTVVVINKWSVTGNEKTSGKHKFLEAICECGTVRWAEKSYFYRHSQCIQCTDRSSHGDTGTELHKKWCNMISRCNPKSKSYGARNYAWRGVRVCSAWEDYNSFKKWALDNGYAPGLSLDRIDNDKGYDPTNCRWVNSVQQQKNKRNNHLITFNGVSMIESDWCALLGVSAGTVARRIKKGWSLQKALTKGKTNVRCE